MKRGLKSLIMDLCQGRYSHPISVDDAKTLLNNEVTDSKLKSLINNPDLFSLSLYECKTGKLGQPDPTLVPKPNTKETALVQENDVLR